MSQISKTCRLGLSLLLLSAITITEDAHSESAAPSVTLEVHKLREDISSLSKEIAEIKSAVLAMKRNFDEARQKNTPVQQMSVKLDSSSTDDFALGSPTAPVTIMEFSDFQCGFCARFHKTIFQKIKSSYIDTGKVRYIFRDFTLDMHPYAPEAASIAACAQRQGLYTQMQDAFFDNPDSLGEGDFDSIISLVDGLDVAKLNNCRKTPEMTIKQSRQVTVPNLETQADMKEGERIGVMGTPAFYIGRTTQAGQEMPGYFIRGDQDLELFSNVIEGILGS